MSFLNEPVILSFCRTPLGKYAGVLKNFRPDDLLAIVIKEAVKKANVPVEDIDEVIAGCANQAGEDNRNIARMSSLLAGLSVDTPAITLNRLCASGLDAIVDGARKIALGEHRLVVVGGVESMTRAPYVLAKNTNPFSLGAPQIFDTSLGFRFFNEKMREITAPEHNGITAERLADKYKITRIKQDEFALLSHKKAVAAQKSGFFASEIFPLKEVQKNKELIINQDEGPRSDTNLEKLSFLKAAFKEGGSVTAGNSSSLNDGAGALVLCSKAYAQSLGLSPLARILGFASSGVHPTIMGIGPVPATVKLMSKLNLSINDFDAIEVNEAFAVQVLAVALELKIPLEKLNPNGGAIALGHPLGCSGTRIAMTLINQLRNTKQNLGLATLCVGLGQGVSMAIEALS